MKFKFLFIMIISLMLFLTVSVASAASLDVNNSSYGFNLPDAKVYVANVTSGPIHNGDHFSVTLKHYSGAPVKYGTMEFSILNKTFTRLTDRCGVAKFDVNVDDADCGKNLTVYYRYRYTVASWYTWSSTICVKAGTELSNMTSGVVCNGDDYQVTLKDFNGNVIPNKEVHFRLTNYHIDRDYYGITDDEGVAKFKIDATSKYPLGKSFNVFCECDPGDEYIPCNGSSDICVKAGTELSNMTSGVVCNGDDYQVTLKDFNGNVIPNKEVHFRLTNYHIDRDYYGITDDEGVAKFKIDATSKYPLGKSFNVFCECDPGDEYIPCSGSSDILIKSNTKFDNATTDVYAGDYFNVTLKDTVGNVIPNAEVHIKLLGDTYNVTTDNNGVAKLKLINVSNSPVIISYKFDGDDYKYLASNGCVSVNVHGLS